MISKKPYRFGTWNIHFHNDWNERVEKNFWYITVFSFVLDVGSFESILGVGILGFTCSIEFTAPGKKPFHGEGHKDD